MEDDEKEEILKRLKMIEDENKVTNKAENKDIKEVIDFVSQPLSFKAKELINEIKTIQKNVNYKKLLEVTRKNMISVITEHLKNYLEIFITDQLQ